MSSFGPARLVPILMGALVVLTACGSEAPDASANGSPSSSTTTFELREVLEVAISGSQGFDALEVTCIGDAGTTGCLEPATASGREVVLLDRAGDAKYRLAPAAISNTDVASAAALDLGAMGGSGWGVEVQLTSQGTTAFEDLTNQLVGKQLAIVVDGIVVSAPTVQEPITSGMVQVSGLSEAEARALARELGTGG